jgi:DNA-binding LacI/PurR family transcriptional regulator
MMTQNDTLKVCDPLLFCFHDACEWQAKTGYSATQPQIGYCRRIVTGVAAHAERKGWLLEEMPAIPGVRERLKRSQPDGVIAHILDEPLAEMLQNLKCPVVSVSSNLPEAPFPSIDVDHRAIGPNGCGIFFGSGA